MAQAADGAGVALQVAEAGRTIYARPPVCEGNFRIFLKNFRLYLHLQRITNLADQKASLLLSCSNPKNSAKLQGLYEPLEDPEITYQQFETRLSQLFSPESESLMARREYLSLRQQPNEDFVSFFGNKLSLYCQAYPNPDPSTEQQRYFTEEMVKSLYNIEVKRQLFRRMAKLTPDNLMANITEVIQAEATLVQFNLSETGTHEGLKYSENTNSKAYENVEPMDVSVLRSGTCNVCKQAGHWAKECRQNTVKKSSNKFGGNKFNSGKINTQKKETRVCHRCDTPGHIKTNCRIPGEKLDAVRKRNKEKKNHTSNQPVRHLVTRDTAEEDDQDELIEELGNNTEMSFCQPL